MIYLCRPKIHRNISLGLLGLLSLLLAGCINVQTNLAIYGNEQWSGLSAIQISKEFAGMMEQADTTTSQALEGGGTLTTSSSTDTQDLAEWKARAQALDAREDLNVSFTEEQAGDGALAYILQGQGDQWAALNEVFFEGQADISVQVVKGRREITIRYQPPNTTEPAAGGQAPQPPAGDQPPAPTLEDIEMLKSMGLGVTYRISAGQIIRSNATRVEGNTAIWEFPGLIEVTLTEAAQFSPDSITLAAPPAAAGFSPEIMQRLLEEAAEAPAPGDLTAPGQTTSELPTAAAEPAPPGDAGTMDSPTGTTETPAEAGPAPETSPATADTPPLAPAAGTDNLPASGAVLPVQEPITIALLAALILALLTGAGLAAGRSKS